MALWQECMKKEKEKFHKICLPCFTLWALWGTRRSSYYYVLFLFISVESGKVSPKKFHISRPPKSRSFCRPVSPLIVINLFDFIIPKSKISTIKSTPILPRSKSTLKRRIIRMKVQCTNVLISISRYLCISKSTHVQGVTKNALSECCWSHSALAQSPFAGTPYVWRLIFWSFLTKIKQDQAPQRHIDGKI